MSLLTEKRFQLSSETKEDRFPKVFKTVQQGFPHAKHILSFGCSTGSECFTLAKYFPDAEEILGYDIEKWNVTQAVQERNRRKLKNVFFTSELRPDARFDVIFAMMVFFSIVSPMERKEFDSALVDLAGRLNKNGLMAFHNLEYDFMTTPCAKNFKPIRIWKHTNNRNKDHVYFGGVYWKIK